MCLTLIVKPSSLDHGDTTFIILTKCSWCSSVKGKIPTVVSYIFGLLEIPVHSAGVVISGIGGKCMVNLDPT